MKRVSVKEYEEIKIAFLRKHEDWRVDTSSMNEYGQYHKNYICTDGAVFTEVIEPDYERADVVVKGVKVAVDVKLLRTEGWSTDDAESIVCYEKF